MKKLFKWTYKPGGNCPVQAEGWFLGHYFYFRARHQRATIEFYNTKGQFNLGHDTVKEYVLMETEEFEAGWLEKSICARLIYKGCFKFFKHLLFA